MRVERSRMGQRTTLGRRRTARTRGGGWAHAFASNSDCASKRPGDPGAERGLGSDGGGSPCLGARLAARARPVGTERPVQSIVECGAVAGVVLEVAREPLVAGHGCSFFAALCTCKPCPRSS